MVLDRLEEINHNRIRTAVVHSMALNTEVFRNNNNNRSRSSRTLTAAHNTEVWVACSQWVMIWALWAEWAV